MKAVVIERPEEVRFEELERPAPGPGEVLVRSHKAGVCRTDLELVHGLLTDPRWVTFPCVPGHEWSGSVAEVGPGVTDLRAGDRVVCEGIVPCGHCTRCRTGRTNLCANYDQLGFTRTGGYAEYVLVPRRVVHRIPERVSYDAAVLVEPAAVVMRGLERVRPRYAEAVGVVGIGTLGALAITLARLFTPRTILAYGVRPEELELALELGADVALDSTRPDVEEETRDLTGGGLDVVVETAGAPAAVDLATRVAREGGRVSLLGIAGEGRRLELPSDRIVFRDLEVVGSVSYTSAVWARVVDVVAQGLVDLDPIVTHRFPVERFEDAFALMDARQGRVAKVVLEHVPD